MVRVVALVALVVGAYVLTSETYEIRKLERRLHEATASFDRFVDASVRLHVVVQDDNGHEYVEGKPKLRIIKSETHGGWIDTKTSPPKLLVKANGKTTHKLGAGRDWYVSEDQYRVIRHNDPERLGQLVYGSEGAGKTRALAMWHYFRWLDNIGKQREGGQTAPTDTRLGMVRKEMFLLFGATWYRYLSSDGVFVMCDGTKIQLVHTYRQSKDQGSPIQGFNWSWCGRDEAQDQVDVHEDIESRGRSAPNGLYWQLATATAKDSSAWRELRDVLLASGRWLKQALSIFRSPFTAKRFLADKASTMSPREFRRRYGNPKTGEVDDMLPELAVYYGWDRKRNLVASAQIAADVTGRVLAGYPSYLHKGKSLGLVVAHDPGVIFNTSVVMRMLMYAGVPTWVVVGEYQSKQTTAHEHIQELKKYLRDSFYVDHPSIVGPLPAVFIDPHGKGNAQTDYQTVYMAFQAAGFDAFNPAPITKKIHRSARIEMVNRLLAGAAKLVGDEVLREPPRLLVALDSQGRPVAPKLVEAFESLQKKPGDDNPEGTQRKDEDDKTHAPAALAYGLWPFEQEASTASTQKAARS